VHVFISAREHVIEHLCGTRFTRPRFFGIALRLWALRLQWSLLWSRPIVFSIVGSLTAVVACV